MVLYFQLLLLEISHEFLIVSMCATGPAYLIVLDHRNKMWQGLQKMKFLIKQISPATVTFSLIRSNIPFANLS
jgi:hypothetical protein